MSTAAHRLPEAGRLFAQGRRTGRIPGAGWLVGEIELPG
jgi:hypothetical protein